MLPMDHRALGTYLLGPSERCSECHSNRDSDAKPDRNMPRQNAGDRAQRRA